MNGLAFNGKHSFTDMGLKIQSKVRHILPEPKTVYEDLPGVDGEYDFSNVNPDGRTKYKPFTDEITFYMIGPVNRAKVHEIASWLACGEQQLIYDDEPEAYYLARVINKLDAENLLIQLKSFTAQFKGGPFSFGTTEETHSYTTAGDKTINNPGTFVKPKFIITGSFTTLTLSCGGNTLTYSEAIVGSAIEIDCDKMTCVKDSNTNKSMKLSGKFFEFANSNNTLSIGGTGLDCTIQVSFRPQYL
jgi:predicted phage tail component-like protein